MDMLDLVLKYVNPENYYRSKFPHWNGDHNSNVLCPFHNDSTPSLSLNINGKGGTFCHGCDKGKAGSIIHFEKLLTTGKLTDEQAAEIIYLEHFVTPIATDAVEIEKSIHQKQKNLEYNPRIKELIRTELGLDEETIEAFGLGYDPAKRRVLIPIFDNYDNLVNYRRYILPSMRYDPAVPKMINTKGHGSPPQLFPLDKVNALLSSKQPPLFLPMMAGERDTMLAWNMGIPAFTATVGEGSWRPEWSDIIKKWGVIVGVVQDNDPLKDGKRVGEIAAKKRLAELREAGIRSYIIPIPEPEKYKDFSKWALETGATADDFFKLVAEAQKNGADDNDIIIDDIDPDLPSRPFPNVIDPTKITKDGLYNVTDIRIRPDLLNTKIQVHAIVSGSMTRTYSVPNVFNIGGTRYLLPPSRELVHMVRTGDEAIEKYIKKLYKTKTKPKAVDTIPVTEVEIIPVIQPDRDTPYVVQRCFVIGPDVKTNMPYAMHIIPTTLMETQEIVGLIVDVEPINNTLDTFELTEEIRLELNKFKCDKRSPEGIFNHLIKNCDSIAKRHTGISHRNDWHAVALLTWMSPLKFNLSREGEQRGWVNALALGDTETGKSKVSHALRKLFACGTFVNSENCTFVGMVGGAVKAAGGQFMLRWGKIPLYNRQLVVVEELSGLNTDEISHLSEVRSSGVARLDKGGLSGETPAQTRLLFLSNVRAKTGALGTAASGVRELQELIGHLEDIARFDLIITLVDSEVSDIIINRDKTGDDHTPFTEEEINRYRLLVKFIWSIRPDQIEVTDDAYRACLELTLELAKRYHPSVPIFKAGSGRFKIARLACAIACSQFAWDETKERIVVEPKHVMAVKLLLTRLYDKPSLGYARYSRQRFFLEQIRDEDKLKSAIVQSLRGESKKDMFYRILSHSITFTKMELIESLGIPAMFADRLISGMLQSNVIQKSDKTRPNDWELTPQGRKWIERQNEN